MSTTSTSLAKRPIIRPIGVVSKNVRGARRTPRNMTMCRNRVAVQQPSCGARSQKTDANAASNTRHTTFPLTWSKQNYVIFPLKTFIWIDAAYLCSARNTSLVYLQHTRILQHLHTTTSSTALKTDIFTYLHFLKNWFLSTGKEMLISLDLNYQTWEYFISSYLSLLNIKVILHLNVSEHPPLKMIFQYSLFKDSL